MLAGGQPPGKVPGMTAPGPPGLVANGNTQDVVAELVGRNCSGFPNLHLSTEVLNAEPSFSHLGLLFIQQTCMESLLCARPVLGNGLAAGAGRLLVALQAPQEQSSQ